MDWFQFGSSGPGHERHFTWCLKLGDLKTMGSASSIKGAKALAAEEMIRKLDESNQLPKVSPTKRRPDNSNEVSGMPSKKKAKPFKVSDKTEWIEKHPITRLYEYAKKTDLPEP